MVKITNPYEVYRLLPQTNCTECSLPNCLAFAAAVVKGSKKPADCPYLRVEDRQRLEENIGSRDDFSRTSKTELEALKKRVGSMDLAARAERLGARYDDGKLAVRSLGKEFFIDGAGRVTSECHTHSWMTVLLLSYIVESSGDNPGGSWVPFRELKDGGPMNSLFVQRGEKPLRRLIDDNPDLLGDLLSMFSGREAGSSPFGSDIALTLLPLPKVPLLVCYWQPEGDMESDLSLFFDATANSHLKTETIFSLGVGLVMMFDKIAREHG